MTYSFTGFTPKADAALNEAIRLASELGHTYVGSEHLALALADDAGVAGAVLSNAGIRREAVDARLRLVMGAGLPTILGEADLTPRLRRLLTTKEAYRIEPRKLAIDWSMMRLIVRYGLPSGIQNSVIAIANVVVQSNINAFGTLAVAGCGAYSKIEGFVFLPINSLVIALSTFVGQNLGAQEYERAKKGARFGVLCSILTAETVGVLVYFISPFLIGLFTNEPEAIRFGIQKARICAPFFFLLAASHGFAAVLRGAGKAVVPMVSMLSFWCVVRVTFLHFMVPLYPSINTVNWVYPLTWALSAVFLAIYYAKADWLHTFEREQHGKSLFSGHHT